MENAKQKAIEVAYERVKLKKLLEILLEEFKDKKEFKLGFCYIIVNIHFTAFPKITKEEYDILEEWIESKVYQKHKDSEEPYNPYLFPKGDVKSRIEFLKQEISKL